MSENEFESSIDEEVLSHDESKCDYCNVALHDCSLCGVGWDDCPYPDTPIC